MGCADDGNGLEQRIQRRLATVWEQRMKSNEISVYYVVNKLGRDMNLCFCGTTLLPDICKFSMKYLLNIYESLRCLHIYKYLQVHYKVTTKFLWYIHTYGITMFLYGYYNLYNIFQSLLMHISALKSFLMTEILPQLSHPAGTTIRSRSSVLGLCTKGKRLRTGACASDDEGIGAGGMKSRCNMCCRSICRFAG